MKNGYNIAEVFSGMKSDYTAANSSRLKRRRSGLAAGGSGADYHYRNEADFLRIMEVARDVCRNDIVVGVGVRRLVQQVIQDGFTLDVRTGDEAIDREITDRWNEFAEDPDNCDRAGELTFHGMEKAVFRAMIVDGDIFALPLRTGPLELIEAHRVRTPRTKKNVVHGILLDEFRKRKEYWISREDVDPHKQIPRISDMRRISARDRDGFRQVFHLYDPDRSSQTRGVSTLAPALDSAGMHDDIQFAKLVQQQVVSCITFIRKLDVDVQAGVGSALGATREDSLERVVEDIAPGLSIGGRPGESIEGFSPNIPNAEFFQQATMILGFIAVQLNLPLPVLLLDPTNTNFSGWRGALDQAKIGFRQLQKGLRTQFHRRVFIWKVRQFIGQSHDLRIFAEGPNGANIFKHRWNPPIWAYLEPLKDATADNLRLRNGLTSRRRFHAERGADWDEVSTEIVEDSAMAIRKAKLEAIAINKELDDGNPVHWRELLNSPMPEGLTVPPPEAEEEEEPDARNQRSSGPKASIRSV